MFKQMIVRDFRFYKSQMMVVIGAVALTVAVISGALLTGDSVKRTLFELIDYRLGNLNYAAKVHSGTVTQKLLGRATPVLNLDGFISSSDNSMSSKVNLYGIDTTFSTHAKQSSLTLDKNKIYLNKTTALSLNVSVGDSLVLRLKKPSFLSDDFIMNSSDELFSSIRVQVGEILNREQLADLSLENNQRQPLNAFVDLEWLNGKLGLTDRCNLMLSSEPFDKAQLSKAISLNDFNCYVTKFPNEEKLVIRSRDGFIPSSVVKALQSLECEEQFSWFVNSFNYAEVSVPYSFVAGTDRFELTDEEIVISDWLAEDLRLIPGDTLNVKYYVAGEKGELIKKSRMFKVKNIVPLTASEFNKSYMPDFPGLSDAESCSDWDSELPIDLEKVREKDEAYWNEFKGTPKAFVSLTTARKLWTSRFGNTTSLQLPIGFSEKIDTTLQSYFSQNPIPQLQLLNIRETALKGATNSVDFSGLFIGLSFFIIISGMILTSLMLKFFIDSRNTDIGVLRTIGFNNRLITRFFTIELSTMVLIGSVTGIAAGVIWCHFIVWALNAVWSGAVGATTLSVHISPTTLVLSFCISVLLMWTFTVFILRRVLKKEIRQLTESLPTMPISKFPKKRIVTGTVLILLGLYSSFKIPVLGQNAMGLFIGVGMVLLIATILIFSSWLTTTLKIVKPEKLSVMTVALRNLSRRAGRTTAVVALLALGAFLTISVGINQKRLSDDYKRRGSGTGGFSFYLDTNFPLKRSVVDELTGANVPFRVSKGTSADCQNLNQVLKPQIVACDSNALAVRNSFTFLKSQANLDSTPWNLLENHGEMIPVVTDLNALTWILQKKVGDVIEYEGEGGKTFKLRIVGAIENSILQGSLIMDEKYFLRMFPSSGGYNILLLDDDSGVKELTRSLSRYGVNVESTAVRLNRFNVVQNSYLRIFLVLGALGVLLGLLGSSFMMIRNLMERYYEFAWMKTAGFQVKDLKRILLIENLFTVGSGLLCGTVASAIVVIPVLRSPNGFVPWFSLILLYVIIIIFVTLSSSYFSRKALSKCSVEDLRNE